MKLPVSTEWLLHCTSSLAQLEPGATAPAAQLALCFDLPPASLAEHPAAAGGPVERRGRERLRGF